MPTEIGLTGGGSVKVVAPLDDVVAAVQAGHGVVDTQRFAGFRGNEPVAGERVVVNVAAVAYAIDIHGH